MSTDLDRDPVVVFWELTLACALNCTHCRAEARPKRHPMELSTDECKSVMDRLASFGVPPIVVLSGGDPFMRRDLFEIAQYGLNLGLTVSVSPSATALVTRDRLQRLVDIGVQRVSFSLDGATAETHDAFRGFEGAFERTFECFAAARDVGLSFQINTAVSRRTRPELPAMSTLVRQAGAALWDLFFLVPTGRASADDVMSPEEHEETYAWLLSNSGEWPFRAKTTLGQPFRRASVLQDLKRSVPNHNGPAPEEVGRYWHGPPTNDGKGILFISHFGGIYPSGFLPLITGNVRVDDVVAVYRHSSVFTTLRDSSLLKGKCGACPFNRVCGGCRARAYAITGDLMAADPTCSYQPALAAAI